MSICCTSYSVYPVLMLLLEHACRHPGDLNTSVNDFLQDELNAPKSAKKNKSLDNDNMNSTKLRVKR